MEAAQVTRAGLIVAMLDAAHGVVEAYHGDLRHDARAMVRVEKAAAFLWSPHKHGSFLILLNRDGKPNQRAASCFDAMRSQAAQWRLITIDGDSCFIAPIAADDACAVAWSHLREAEKRPAEAISELHM